MQDWNRDIGAMFLKPYVRRNFSPQLFIHVSGMLSLSDLVRQWKADIDSLITTPTALGPDQNRYDYVETACLPYFRSTDMAPVNAQVMTD